MDHLQMIFPARNLHLEWIFQFAMLNYQRVIINQQGFVGPSVIVPQLHQTLFATRDVVGTTLPRRGWSLGAENLVGLSNLIDMENATETNNETWSLTCVEVVQKSSSHPKFLEGSFCVHMFRHEKMSHNSFWRQTYIDVSQNGGEIPQFMVIPKQWGKWWTPPWNGLG